MPSNNAQIRIPHTFCKAFEIQKPDPLKSTQIAAILLKTILKYRQKRQDFEWSGLKL